MSTTPSTHLFAQSTDVVTDGFKAATRPRSMGDTSRTYGTDHRVPDPSTYGTTNMLTMLEATVTIDADGRVWVTIPDRQIRSALAEMKEG